MKKKRFKVSYTAKNKTALKDLVKVDLVTLESALKEGAVWRDGRRIRQIVTPIHANEKVELFIDEHLFSLTPPIPTLKEKTKEWSVWFKPAGLLSQGSQWGDRGSLLRFVEIELGATWLIHRLDREASGLLVFAHTKKSAAYFSELIKKNELNKKYQVRVNGIVEKDNQTIDFPLEAKKAITHLCVLERGADSTLLEVTLETGRTHQIRRHLEMIGHPLVGDPLYGRGNKNREGMILLCSEISFVDPITKKNILIKTA